MKRNIRLVRQPTLVAVFLLLGAFALIGCGAQQSEDACEAPAESAAFAKPDDLWIDETRATIGKTGRWTNKVELADINSDDLVDVLFANGGDYETPGKPAFSQVFLNRGPDQKFEEATRRVLPDAMLARVIKVRDVNADGVPNILVGTTYETQSQLYLGDGSGDFTNVTKTHLPRIEASIGDLEFGDVDGDADLDVVLADWGPGDPMTNEGGRTMLWLNDGTGHFTDVTGARMPDVAVGFSWELEFVDVDNDYDLDILVSCKVCKGSFLFKNDGEGASRTSRSRNFPSSSTTTISRQWTLMATVISMSSPSTMALLAGNISS